MPTDLKYWRTRIATQTHSGSGMTIAQLVELLDELEAGRAERTRLLAVAEAAERYVYDAAPGWERNEAELEAAVAAWREHSAALEGR